MFTLGQVFQPVTDFFKPVPTTAEKVKFSPSSVAIQDDEKIITAPDKTGAGTLTKGATMADPLTLATAAKGFLDTAKELNPTSSARSGDAFSGFGSDDDRFTSGDIIIGGSKDSILTLALIGATVIIVATILSRNFKGKKK